jgi:hypothetical protein
MLDSAGFCALEPVKTATKQLRRWYPLQVAGRISIVSLDHHGSEWYCVTDGRSVFEAVRNAVRFFADPYWRGALQLRSKSVEPTE